MAEKAAAAADAKTDVKVAKKVDDVKVDDVKVDQTEDGGTDQVICICDDPFRVGSCPAHPSSDEYPQPPTPEVVTVTASHRVEPKKKSVWHGYAFMCPKCEEGSIMHWGEKGFEYCPSCGSKLEYEWEK